MNKLNPTVVIIIGSLPIAYCWLEFFYRINLYFEYGSQPFLNHVGDGYFKEMYFVATISLIIFAIGLKLVPSRKIINYSAIASVLIYILSLYYINVKDILVNYSEFVQNL